MWKIYKTRHKLHYCLNKIKHNSIKSSFCGQAITAVNKPCYESFLKQKYLFQEGKIVAKNNNTNMKNNKQMNTNKGNTTMNHPATHQNTNKQNQKSRTTSPNATQNCDDC